MKYEICSVTHKRCYTEKNAAECIQIAKKHNNKYIPKRKYYCKHCGFWHLTSNVDEGSRQKHKPLKIIGGNYESSDF